MTSTIKRSLALVTVPVIATAVGCSSSGGSSPAAQGTTTPPVATTEPATTEPTPENTACALTANTAAKPPANLPTPSDATFYEKMSQGSTTLYFAYVPGTDVRVRRDAVKGQLSGAGYDIKGSDAEANTEADLEFEGKGHGESSLQVIHRDGCTSQLRLRYKLGA
jgi:hypothetical protein